MDHFGTPNPSESKPRLQPTRGAHLGRYIISVDDAVAAHAGTKARSDVVIHDTNHLSEQCNTDQIKHKSHFGDLEWAIGKGYRPCRHCMTTPGEHPTE